MGKPDIVERCRKPGCGALERIGNPCTDWDCPQTIVSAPQYQQLQAEVTRLRTELATARDALKAISIEDLTDEDDGEYSRGWIDGRKSLKGIAIRALKNGSERCE